MPRFKLAHIKEQGQNMLLFPLDSDFQFKTPNEQNSILEELEYRAHSAGLSGQAAVFWQSGGRTFSLGPRPWQNFLRSVSFSKIVGMINKSISW